MTDTGRILDRSLLSDLRFLAADAWTRFGFRVPALIAMMVSAHLLEGLAVASMLPLIASLGVPGSPSSVAAWLGGVPARLGLPEGPVGAGVMLLCLIVASALCFLGQARYAAWLQCRYAMQWQVALFEAFLRADYAFLGERRAADVVNALVTETDRARYAFNHACQVIAAAANLVVFLVVACLISATITLAVTAAGIALFLATRPLIKRSYSYGAGITETAARIQADAIEFTTAIKSVKAQVAEGFATGRLKAAADRLAHLYFWTWFDVQKARAIFEFGGAAAIATLLLAGPSLLGVDVATVLVVLALFVRLLPRFTALQQGLHGIASSLPALGNLRTQLAAARAAAEADDPRPLPEPLRRAVPGITFRNVTVTRGGRHVLGPVDLVVPGGKVVAVVGPSGSGKSTLVDTILGLVPLASGTITVAGVPLADLPLSSWRRAVGYVGQDTMLLGGTVAENVRLGNDVSDAAIVAALGRASAGFVDRLGHGIDTLLGDRGSRLSGGERQRIGLARALAVPRLLYILDEATSALDAATEAEIVETIAALAGSATVILVAHRFSAIRMADEIHVLEGGRIVESGRWDDLDRPGTRFRALRDLQQAPPEPRTA